MRLALAERRRLAFTVQQFAFDLAAVGERGLETLQQVGHVGTAPSCATGLGYGLWLQTALVHGSGFRRIMVVRPLIRSHAPAPIRALLIVSLDSHSMAM
jgi:hypothetical protein